MSIMARIGGFAFQLSTASFQELQRRTAYDWQGQRRIGRDIAQQYVGHGEDVITLQGVIYPAFRGGLGQMGALRGMARDGVPYPFIYCFESVGQFVGLFCIKDINEKRRVFFDNGAPRAIEFDVTLIFYGPDGG